MRRYTTPTVTLTVKGVDLTNTGYVYVTFKQDNVVLTFSNENMSNPEIDVTKVGDDTVITCWLSQEETSQFKATYKPVEVQVNWRWDEVYRAATEIAKINITDNLWEEVTG